MIPAEFESFRDTVARICGDVAALEYDPVEKLVRFRTHKYPFISP